MPRHRLYRCGILLRHGIELHTIGAQSVGVNAEADRFHFGKNRQERQFDVRQQFLGAVLTYRFVKCAFQFW